MENTKMENTKMENTKKTENTKVEFQTKLKNKKLHNRLHAEEIEHSEYQKGKIGLRATADKELMKKFSKSKLRKAEHSKTLELHYFNYRSYDEAEIEDNGEIKNTEYNTFNKKIKFSDITKGKLNLNRLLKKALRKREKKIKVKDEAKKQKKKFEDKKEEIKEKITEENGRIEVVEKRGSLAIKFKTELSKKRELWNLIEDKGFDYRQFGNKLYIKSSYDADIEELHKTTNALLKKEKEIREKKEEKKRKKEEGKKKLNNLFWIKEAEKKANRNKEKKEEEKRFLEKFRLNELKEELNLLNRYSKSGTNNSPFVSIKVELPFEDRDIVVYNQEKPEEVVSDTRDKEYNKTKKFSDKDRKIAQAISDQFEDSEIYIAKNYDKKESFLNVRTGKDTISVSKQNMVR